MEEVVVVVIAVAVVVCSIRWSPIVLLLLLLVDDVSNTYFVDQLIVDGNVHLILLEHQFHPKQWNLRNNLHIYVLKHLLAREKQNKNIEQAK